MPAKVLVKTGSIEEHAFVTLKTFGIPICNIRIEGRIIFKPVWREKNARHVVRQGERQTRKAFQSHHPEWVFCNYLHGGHRKNILDIPIGNIPVVGYASKGSLHSNDTGGIKERQIAVEVRSTVKHVCHIQKERSCPGQVLVEGSCITKHGIHIGGTLNIPAGNVLVKR